MASIEQFTRKFPNGNRTNFSAPGGGPHGIRVRETNGSVILPIVATDDNFEGGVPTLWVGGPCFYKPAKLQKQIDDFKLSSEYFPDSYFYGIVQSTSKMTQNKRDDGQSTSHAAKRYDICVRGLYTATHRWLWTPERYTVQDDGTFTGKDNIGTLDDGDKLKKYRHNCGVILYDCVQNIIFCVQKSVAVDLMEYSNVQQSEMFITLGQFFNRIPDWRDLIKREDERDHRKSAVHKMKIMGLPHNSTAAIGSRKSKEEKRNFRVFLRT